MPHTYLVDVEKIIDALSTDDELILEERLTLLAVITDYIARVSKKLENEMAGEKGNRDQ